MEESDNELNLETDVHGSPNHSEHSHQEPYEDQNGSSEIKPIEK